MSRFVYALIVWIIIGVVAGIAFAVSGIYPVGADVHHWPITVHLISYVRDRAVDHRTADMTVPPLDNPAMIKAGARKYAKHCAQCHLAPGSKVTPLHLGLYPRPPVLRSFHPQVRYSFWAIKHGFKMTGMPAWGKTLDDKAIWSLVAFLEKQPDMTGQQYRALVEPDDGAKRSNTAAVPRPMPASPASAN